MTTGEKVAHLKGVIEGMDYDVTTKEGKLISLITDILSDMCEDIESVQDDTNTLFDYADELDEDLGELEKDVYGDDYDFDDECDCDCDDCCDCDDDDCDCGCEEK